MSKFIKVKTLEEEVYIINAEFIVCVSRLERKGKYDAVCLTLCNNDEYEVLGDLNSFHELLQQTNKEQNT